MNRELDLNRSQTIQGDPDEPSREPRRPAGTLFSRRRLAWPGGGRGACRGRRGGRRGAAACSRALDLGDRPPPDGLARGAAASPRRRAGPGCAGRGLLAAGRGRFRRRLAGSARGARRRSRRAACARARSRRRPARRSGRRQRSHGEGDAPGRPAAQRLPRRPDRAPAQGVGGDAMTTLDAVRDELSERRERLARLAVTVRESQLVELLRQVDSALERLDGGTWGGWGVCLGSVEPDRLAADSLVRVCLDCLSASERRALERDLETAARVQAALLPPRQLAHDGWEVALLWEPLGPVSGGHYDLLRPKNEGEPPHL